jgi:hypothetical protein
VLCGLLAATLAALLYGFALAANDARAGTEQATEPAEIVAASAAPADPAPPLKSPQVVTDQLAEAGASTTQQQPTNIVISIRIDSPGDDGPVTQTNVAIADASGANAASTTQGTAPTDGSGQDASTEQQAGASSTVSQDGAGNLVVVVRINSPGNNGPVSQTNAAVGTSNAENTGSTTQGAPTEGPAPATMPENAAAGTSARASRRRPHRKVAPAAPRHKEAVAPAPGPAAASAVVSSGSGDTPAGAVPAQHPRHAASVGAKHRGRAAVHGGSSSDRANTSPLSRAIANAGDLLGTVAPRAPLGAPRRSADVSGSVIVSLLAVLALGAFFVAWSLRPGWLRARSGLLR